VVSVEPVKTLETQRLKTITIPEKQLRLEEESEEFEEEEVTEATAPATEAPKHGETPTKSTEESLMLDEEGPEEEEPKAVLAEEQTRKELKGRAC
jgi:hypothetical protein